MGSRRDEYDDYDDDEYDDRPRPRSRRGFRCPFCGTDEPPITREQIAAGGWAVLIILVFVCLPLFWIGLLIKEEYYVCYECGMRVGR